MSDAHLRDTASGPGKPNRDQSVVIHVTTPSEAKQVTDAIRRDPCLVLGHQWAWANLRRGGETVICARCGAPQ